MKPTLKFKMHPTAALLPLSLALPAQGAIVYTSPVDLDKTPDYGPETTRYYSIGLNAAGGIVADPVLDVGDITFTLHIGAGSIDSKTVGDVTFRSGDNGAPDVMTVGSYTTTVPALAPDTEIGANGTFIDAQAGLDLPFAGGSNDWSVGDRTDQFIGLKLYGDNPGDVYYGWVRLLFGGGRGFKVVDFAYEDQAGVSILAGSTESIPEPAFPALLAGAAGLFALRRRRK